ncbi:hypothetical protein ABPG75_013006 [Micractinium tetrahymenae]
MRALLLLAAFLAVANAAEWEVCKPKTWLCKFGVANGKVYDCVQGQFAREALAASGVRMAKKIIADPATDVGPSCKVTKTSAHEGCYYSVVQWMGKQYVGVYEFAYDLTFKCADGSEHLYHVETAHEALRVHPHFRRFMVDRYYEVI